MAIDNFGKYEPDPKEQKAWEALRTRAFFAAAAEKLGERSMTASSIIDCTTQAFFELEEIYTNSL